MPVEKGKVGDALKAKYKGTSLTKELREGLAEVYAEQIEDEAGIEEYLNTQDAIIRMSIKDADRRSQAAAAKARQEAADAAAGKKPEDDSTGSNQQDQGDNSTPDGMPDWFKPFATQFGTLASSVTALQKDKATQTIDQLISAHPDAQGVPVEFYKRWPRPDTPEGVEAFVQELKAEYAPFAKEVTAQTFSTSMPVGGNAPKGGGNTSKIPVPADDQVDRIAKLL